MQDTVVECPEPRRGERRIETTGYQNYECLIVAFGLDMGFAHSTNELLLNTFGLDMSRDASSPLSLRSARAGLLDQRAFMN